MGLACIAPPVPEKIKLCDPPFPFPAFFSRFEGNKSSSLKPSPKIPETHSPRRHTQLGDVAAVCCGPLSSFQVVLVGRDASGRFRPFEGTFGEEEGGQEKSGKGVRGGKSEEESGKEGKWAATDYI